MNKKEKLMLNNLYLKTLLELGISKEYSLKMIEGYFNESEKHCRNKNLLFLDKISMIQLIQKHNLDVLIDLSKNNIDDKTSICHIIEMNLKDNNIEIQNKTISIFLKNDMSISLETNFQKNFVFSYEKKESVFFNSKKRPKKSLTGTQFMKCLEEDNSCLINPIFNSFKGIKFFKINGEIIVSDKDNFMNVIKDAIEKHCPKIYNQTGLKEVLKLCKLKNNLQFSYIISYLNIFASNPEIEKISKSMFSNVSDYITYINLFVLTTDGKEERNSAIKELSLLFDLYNNENCNKIEDLLGCPKYILNKIAKDNNYSQLIHHILPILKNETIKNEINNSNIDLILYFVYQYITTGSRKKYQIGIIDVFHENTINNVSNLSDILSYLITCGYDMNKLIKYIFNLSFLMDSNVATLLLRIYDINFLYNDLNIKAHENNLKNPLKFNLYPENINVYEKELAKLQNVYKNKEKLQIFQSVSKEASKKDGIFDNFVIVSPKSPDDLVREGEAMNHCVGGYIDRYISQKNIVYFMRYLDRPNDSYVTFDIIDNRLNQFVLEHDKQIEDKETLLALKKWCTANKIQNYITV